MKVTSTKNSIIANPIGLDVGLTTPITVPETPLPLASSMMKAVEKPAEKPTEDRMTFAEWEELKRSKGKVGSKSTLDQPTQYVLSPERPFRKPEKPQQPRRFMVQANVTKLYPDRGSSPVDGENVEEFCRWFAAVKKPDIAMRRALDDASRILQSQFIDLRQIQNRKGDRSYWQSIGIPVGLGERLAYNVLDFYKWQQRNDQYGAQLPPILEESQHVYQSLQEDIVPSRHSTPSPSLNQPSQKGLY